MVLCELIDSIVYRIKKKQHAIYACVLNIAVGCKTTRLPPIHDDRKDYIA